MLSIFSGDMTVGLLTLEKKPSGVRTARFVLKPTRTSKISIGDFTTTTICAVELSKGLGFTESDTIEPSLK
ncbi:hypothetical protein D3C86_2060590 [compost metagenome]